MEKIYFVMPAYNESENILITIEQWYPVIERINKTSNCEAYLVIANDGSKDNTFQRMTDFKAERELDHFTPLDKQNSGHGATLLYLYRYALSEGADFIFQTDSDGQTNPDEFWEMFDNRHEYDFQIGNRNKREDGKNRILVTKVLKIVVWLMFHEWVTDANTPFRLMERNKLSSIIEVLPKDFFLSNVAITTIAKKWDYTLRFYPISFKPRQAGVNSINMKRILKIGKQAIKDFYHLNKNLRRG